MTGRIFLALSLLALAGCSLRPTTHCIQGVTYVSNAGAQSALTPMVDRQGLPVPCHNGRID